MVHPVLELVSVADLTFDAENPRLPQHVQGHDEKAVLNFMIEDANIPELMMSIAENGYFWGEPLLVVPAPSGGKLTVVEGNRRLSSLKLLKNPEMAPASVGAIKSISQSAKNRVESVPVLIFENRDQILSYLGYRHITGIKEWDALAKARYLRQLRKNLGPDSDIAHKELAKKIGSRASTVAKMLAGLSLLDAAENNGILRDFKLKQEDIPFSLLTTGIGWESISEFIGLKSASDVDQNDLIIDNLKDLFSWIFLKPDGIRSRLGDSRNFEKLARVVKSQDALSALRRGESLSTADTLTNGPLEAVRVGIQGALNLISNAQVSLKHSPDLNQSDIEFSSELEAQAISLKASIKAIIERRTENERQRSMQAAATEIAKKALE